MHLGDVGTRLGAPGLPVQAGEAQFVEGGVGGAGAAEFRSQCGQFLAVAAFGNPGGAQRRQAGADVDLGGGVGIGAGTVIDVDGRILFAAEGGRRVGLGNLAHGDAKIGAGTRDVDLLGIGERLDRGGVHMGVGGDEFFVGVHGAPCVQCAAG